MISYNKKEISFHVSISLVMMICFKF